MALRLLRPFSCGFLSVAQPIQTTIDVTSDCFRHISVPQNRPLRSWAGAGSGPFAPDRSRVCNRTRRGLELAALALLAVVSACATTPEVPPEYPPLEAPPSPEAASAQPPAK